MHMCIAKFKMKVYKTYLHSGLYHSDLQKEWLVTELFRPVARIFRRRVIHVSGCTKYVTACVLYVKTGEKGDHVGTWAPLLICKYQWYFGVNSPDL